MPIAPSGERTSLGIGKESSFGSAATPSVFLICSDVSFNGMNDFLAREGARKRVGRTIPATGMFMGKGSLTAEADPDNLGALLALTMGTEAFAANASNPGAAPTLTGVTLTAATTYVGAAVWCTPSAMTGIVPGVQLAIDTAGNLENVTVKAVTATQFAVPLTKTHLAGVSITAGTLQLGYDHTFTLGSPRNSFTAQSGRIVDTVNAYGCKISQLDLSMSEKSILTAKLTAEYQGEAIVSSPTTPSYSTLYPFVFETSANMGKVLGAQSDAAIISWNCSVNTGLITDYPQFGGGRFRAQMPETLTKVSGGMTLGFETDTLLKLFWGSPSAANPLSAVMPVNLEFDVYSQDFINSAVQYALKLIFANAMITAVDVPIRANNYLTQQVKFEAYETSNGSGDDLKAILTNAQNAISI